MWSIDCKTSDGSVLFLGQQNPITVTVQSIDEATAARVKADLIGPNTSHSVLDQPLEQQTSNFQVHLSAHATGPHSLHLVISAGDIVHLRKQIKFTAISPLGVKTKVQSADGPYEIRDGWQRLFVEVQVANLIKQEIRLNKISLNLDKAMKGWSIQSLGPDDQILLNPDDVQQFAFVIRRNLKTPLPVETDPTTPVRKTRVNSMQETLLTKTIGTVDLTWTMPSKADTPGHLLTQLTCVWNNVLDRLHQPKSHSKSTTRQSISQRKPSISSPTKPIPPVTPISRRSRILSPTQITPLSSTPKSPGQVKVDFILTRWPQTVQRTKIVDVTFTLLIYADVESIAVQHVLELTKTATSPLHITTPPTDIRSPLASPSLDVSIQSLNLSSTTGAIKSPVLYVDQARILPLVLGSSLCTYTLKPGEDYAQVDCALQYFIPMSTEIGPCLTPGIRIFRIDEDVRPIRGTLLAEFETLGPLLVME